MSVSNTLKLRASNSDSGTENTTSGMSANANHSHSLTKGGYILSTQVTSGSETNNGFDKGNYWGGEAKAKNTIQSASVAHTHSIYLRGNVTLENGDTETRPENYTIRIWKRTA